MGRLLLLLIIVIALVGTGFFLPAQEAEPPQSPMRSIAEAVLKLGGRVEVTAADGKTIMATKAADLPEGEYAITRVDFGGQSRVKDADLARLGELKDLAELNLSHTRISDDGLKALESLTSLRRLYLSETSLTDQAFESIAKHQNLESLDMSGTKITDATPQSLKKLPKLSRLFLSRTEITGEGLAGLSELPELTVLHVTGREFSAAELRALSTLARLEELSVTTNNEGLAKLAEFTNLKRLTVHGGGITDDAAPLIASLTKLEELRLSQTGLSERAARQIKESLKTCRVVAHPVSRHSAFFLPGGPGQGPVIRWQPGDPKTAWPGLVPRPSKLKGIVRWQLETREPRSEIRAVDYSPNGRHIACATAAGHVRVYDANTLALLKWIPAHPGGANVLAYSPDGSRLATGGNDRTVRIWDLEGKELHALKGHKSLVTALAWSPDGQSLASGSWDQAVRFWKADGSRSQEWKGHTKAVVALAFSPDGTQVASGSGDFTIRIWDLSGQTLHTLKGHTSNVTALAWHARGTLLASGSWDRTIRFWNPKTGKSGPVLEGHTYRVNGIEWHPDGSTLASVGDQTLRTWTQDGTALKTIKKDDDHLLCLSWKHDGNDIATGSRFSSLLRINHLNDNTDRVIGDAHPGGITEMAWHPSGDRIAAACRERAVRLITADGRAGAVMSGAVARTVAWNPQGTQLASAGDMAVRLWNGQGIPMGTLTEHSKNILSLGYSPDGKLLATAAEDNTARIWSEGLVRKIITLKDIPRRVAFSPDGQRIAVASDKRVTVWNIDGTPGPEFSDAPASLVDLAWNKTTDKIAVGGWSKALQTWDSQGQKQPPQSQVQGILDIAVHPQGEKIAMGLFEGKVALAEADGSNAKVIEAHAGPVNAACWHPEGKTLATGGYDNTLRFWDAETLSPVRGTLFFGDGSLVTFTAGGQLEHGELSMLENALVYLVKTEDGQTRMLSPSEFEKAFQAAGE
jgi:WD40 repeat protein